jgi:hypothetical protein
MHEVSCLALLLSVMAGNSLDGSDFAACHWKRASMVHKATSAKVVHKHNIYTLLFQLHLQVPTFERL